MEDIKLLLLRIQVMRLQKNSSHSIDMRRAVATHSNSFMIGVMSRMSVPTIIGEETTAYRLQPPQRMLRQDARSHDNHS